MKPPVDNPILATARPTEARALAEILEIARLENQSQWGALDELLGHLEAPDPLVRSEAARALARVTHRLLVRSRSSIITWHRDNTVALAERVLVEMRARLRGPSALSREGVAEALGFLKHQAATEMLLAALDDVEPAVRAAAAVSLGRIADPLTVAKLAGAMSDPSEWVRRSAASSLGAIAAPAAIPALTAALHDDQALVRASITTALGRFDHAKARLALRQLLEDPDPSVRWLAARGLGRVGDAGALAALAALVDDRYVLFGETVGQVAALSAERIVRRERGVIGTLRRALQALKAARQRRLRAHQAATEPPPDQDLQL